MELLESVVEAIVVARENIFLDDAWNHSKVYLELRCRLGKKKNISVKALQYGGISLSGRR